MKHQIQAILLDMGGTLRRTTRRSQAEEHLSVQRIMDLVGASGSVTRFGRSLEKQASAYKRWAEQTHIELNESDLWTKWMLPEFPPERVSELAVQLNQLYREATGLREVLPESREVVIELFRRGYRLGLVSNTTSSVEVPAVLQELEITGCFETVILSAVMGKRKPNPDILLEATRQMDIAPEYCAYVGDRVDRDIAGARRAGFSQAIILRDPRQPGIEEKESSFFPDHSIKNLRELLSIFPPRDTRRVNPPAVYNASLSTMWAIQTFPSLADFVEFSRRIGFARIELNHKINSAMLEGVDFVDGQVSSVHEPCPADISTNDLKERDWLISSTNEENRCRGVHSIERSIDLAARLHASAVVIHAGHVRTDQGLEKQLRALHAADRRESDEYREIKAQMIRARTESAEAGFESVKKSLLELLTYAEGTGVRLAIENRYHYMEFPSPDELEILLGLADPDRIGFLYDVGHAETLDQLGFYPHEEWLKRFAPRMIGAHIHDVRGTIDHYAPGLGTVDFDMVSAYLPDRAFRTCEFQTFNTPEQVKAGLRILVERGCIKLQHQ